MNACVNLVAGQVRLDLYGEVQEAGRIAAFMSREEAMALSKKLGLAALKLPEVKIDPNEFV